MAEPPVSDEDMVHVAILGGGPGGIGPLVRASRIGKLNALLKLGVAIFDKQPADQYGNGSLGSYVISSNTSASAFLNHFMREVQGESSELFDPMMSSPLVREIEAYHHSVCPLRLAGKIFALAAGQLRKAMSKWSSCSTHFETTVQSVTLLEDGSLEVKGLAKDNTVTTVRTRNVVMAMGGQQGLNLVDPPLRKRTVTGLTFLTEEGVKSLRHKLRNAKSRRVLIVGGSHTSFSVAWACLNRVCYDADDPSKALWNWKRGDITMIHRSQIRVYYNSAAEAKRDGYTELDPGCLSNSGRVNPFSGLRGDSKSLYKDILSGREKRIQLVKITPESANSPIGKGALWKSLLQGVEQVVLAIGMQTNKVPVIRPDGTEVAMLTDSQGLVKSDDRGRLLMSDGKPCPNIFGIGVGHSQPANASQVGGETRTSNRRADGVRMYVQLYGHIILSNLINLPPPEEFPESPGPRKAAERESLSLVAAQPVALSVGQRGDTAALCAVAKAERAASSCKFNNNNNHNSAKLITSPSAPNKPTTENPLSLVRAVSTASTSPKPAAAKPASLVRSISTAVNSPISASSAQHQSSAPIVTPQPPGSASRNSRTRHAWNEPPTKASPKRPLSVKLGLRSPNETRVSSARTDQASLMSKPIPPSVKLAIPQTQVVSPSVVMPGFTTPSTRDKRIVPLSSSKTAVKSAAAGKQIGTPDPIKVTIDTSCAHEATGAALRAPSRTPNSTSSSQRGATGERFEAIALRGAAKHVFSSSLLTTSSSESSTDAATLPPLAGSAQTPPGKTVPGAGRGISNSAVLGLRGSSESTPKRFVQARRTCHPSTSKMLPSVRQTGKYARQHLIVKHAL